MASGTVARIRRKEFQNKVAREIWGLKEDKVTQMYKKNWKDLMRNTGLNKTRKLKNLSHTPRQNSYLV